MKKRAPRLLLGLLLLFAVIAFFFTDGPSDVYAPVPTFVKSNALSTDAPDSVVVSAGAHYARSGFAAFFLGEHNRAVWAQPVKAKIFRMKEQKGGLQITKLGGGMQTTSLTLSDSLGRMFALRSVDKNPIGVLPPFWRKTVAGSFVRDQISASNPYAALVVAPLAQAAKILHPTPQLVFVMPDDQDFEQYATLVGGQLFLMEEKFTTKASLSKKFGPASDLVSTQEMLDRHYTSGRHRIDQWAFARARLFDFLISDWDRHEGQWDWAEYRQQGDIWYKPVAKDRDQAFGRYNDGVLPWLATRKFAARKFQSFYPDYEDVRGLTINASFIDARALSEVSLADFRRLAHQLQQALPDSVLRNAVRQYPPEIYELMGEETFKILKARLKKLPQVAEEFYRILAEEVDVVGSDEPERFVVYRLSQGRTVVEVFRLTQNNLNGAKVYTRTFFAAETKKINLYGLGGNDVFELKGNAAQGSYVHVYGGPGLDQVTDKSTVNGWRKKTIVTDHRQGVDLKPGPKTKVTYLKESASGDTYQRIRDRK